MKHSVQVEGLWKDMLFTAVSSLGAAFVVGLALGAMVLLVESSIPVGDLAKFETQFEVRGG